MRHEARRPIRRSDPGTARPRAGRDGPRWRPRRRVPTRPPTGRPRPRCRDRRGPPTAAPGRRSTVRLHLPTRATPSTAASGRVRPGRGWTPFARPWSPRHGAAGHLVGWWARTYAPGCPPRPAARRRRAPGPSRCWRSKGTRPSSSPTRVVTHRTQAPSLAGAQAARTRSISTPADRRISKVRALITWVAGAPDTPVRRSTTTWSTPCWARRSEATMPTGPPPTTSTVVRSGSPSIRGAPRRRPVELQVLAGEVAGAVGAKKCAGGTHLLGPAQTPGRDGGGDLGIGLVEGDAPDGHGQLGHLALPVGVDPLGQEVVYRHVVDHHVAGHRLHDSGQAGTGPDRRRHQRMRRLDHGARDVDDPAEVPGPHTGQDSLDQLDGAQHVGLERLGPRLGGHLGEDGRRRAGVVGDQYVGVRAGLEHPTPAVGS